MGTAEYHHAQVPPGCRVERVAVVGLARYGTHFVALRVYIGCYFVKWPPAAALKLRFVASTASRPRGFTKPTLCKVPSLGTVAQPSALPGRCAAPYAPPAGSLLAVVALWHWSGAPRSVLVSGLRPFLVCVPRPPLWASPLRGVWPCAGCPSAPKGLPHPSAKYFTLSH